MDKENICELDFESLTTHEAALLKWVAGMKDDFSGEHLRGIRDSFRDQLQFLDRPCSLDLDIVVWFPVWDRKSPKDFLYAHIGAKLERSTKLATYTMTLGLKKDAIGKVKSTIRKVHWDFDFDAEQKHKSLHESKPSSHIQIGGRLGPKFIKFGHAPDVHRKIDKPRIPASPTCFVLMLHWVFLEYAHCPHIGKILKNKKWTQAVCRADSLVLASYFQRGHKFLEKPKGKKFLDYCYS